MLMQQVADYSANLITAKTKRERMLIKSDIDVTLAEMQDCYADYLCATRTVAM